MVSEQLTVVNKAGFHMRPANLFVQAMTKFQSNITIVFNGRDIDGKSIMNVMAACMKQGTEIEIRCEGPDEVEMLRTAAELVRSGLGEE
ncbi:MAG: HPr family phosphocarrier protein [Pseudoflavonifractor capillosus]|uniref:HPr family phosphocarrier protein n=1 Tax=Pseudoflavonifractor capillosus TaxID=106588 RepID=UPI0023F8B048|nr:HPr family phosphocarrier protein [Pseudoflavonifractor capillosus]MCI5928611.1 HPr family phosphocarrier protein [Pseudoflavonifractor capillosus]MDY4659879.1 HPr family phosphocarrier protein [Pseudoflavonifractor capillosus]